jgi:hypothetical protein
MFFMYSYAQDEHLMAQTIPSPNVVDDLTTTLPQILPLKAK